MPLPTAITRIVQTNNVTMLKAVLPKMTASSAEEELLLVQKLLTIAYSGRAEEAAAMILEHFNERDDDSLEKAKYSLFTRLVGDYFLSDQVIRFAFDALPVLYQDVCVDVISEDAGSDVYTPLNRMHIVYKNRITYATIKELIDACNEKGNHVCAAYFKTLAREYAPWSVKPEYIIDANTPGMTTEQLEDTHLTGLTLDIEFPVDDMQSMHRVIRDKLEELLGIRVGDDRESRENLRALVKALASTAGPHERAELQRFLSTNLGQSVRESDTQVNSNINLFKVLGPLNKFVASFESENNWSGKCGKHGCRMMSCNCYHDTANSLEDYDEEYGLETNIKATDWFSGACATCNKRIPRAAYAVRRPLSSGGWVGTYCSFVCVETDEDVKPLDAVEKAMINIVQEQLGTIGLYDRVDDRVHPYASTDEFDEEFDEE